MILSVGLWYCPRPCLRVEHSLRIFCRVHTYPFSCIRASSLVTRNFASARERNSGGYFPKIPKLASSLRRIVLPDTWKGRRAARRAKQHWVDITKDLTGSEPPKNAPGHKEPLLLFIDDQPTTSKTTIYPHAIVFRQEDDLGQRLWRIAHPIPWSEKSCWIRWPTYALVSLYTSLFIFWLICRERVPITGRRQFRCLPVQTLLHTQELPVGENEKERLLPDDDHRVVRAQSVLDRVLLASGLAHLKWKLVVLNEPSEFHFQIS